MWLLLFILLLLILILLPRSKKYSWEDFSNRFGNCTGEMGIYDITKKLIESSYEERTIIDKYNTIFNSKIPENTSYMLKISKSNAKGCDLNILNYVKPITDKFETRNITIRIQTNPWRYAPHFDSQDQIAYMLHGTKKWITWNVDFKNDNEAQSFVQDINNLNFEQMKMYLTNRGISYETKTLKPHDQLYIKYGTWHYVENINTTRGTIMLNLYIKNYDSETDYKFKKLWPTQHERCRNNTIFNAAPALHRQADRYSADGVVPSRSG